MHSLVESLTFGLQAVRFGGQRNCQSIAAVALPKPHCWRRSSHIRRSVYWIMHLDAATRKATDVMSFMNPLVAAMYAAQNEQAVSDSLRASPVPHRYGNSRQLQPFHIDDALTGDKFLLESRPDSEALRDSQACFVLK